MPSRPVRVVTQGPSEPVRVVTQGIADPVRIVSGTPSDPVRVVMSGISTPVKIVEGSILSLPDVASATRILDLQADALGLSDGDPVGIWADASGLGNDFTQTGSARPTKQSSSGKAFVQFNPNSQINPSSDAQWMLGPDFADNLDSMTVFIAAKRLWGGSTDEVVIAKMNNYSTGAGWALYANGTNWLTQKSGGSAYFYLPRDSAFSAVPCLLTNEMLTRDSLHVYTNGTLDDRIVGIDHTGTVDDISTTEHVRLATFGDDLLSGYLAIDLYAAMIYSPAPNASDRAVLRSK